MHKDLECKCFFSIFCLIFTILDFRKDAVFISLWLIFCLDFPGFPKISLNSRFPGWGKRFPWLAHWGRNSQYKGRVCLLEKNPGNLGKTLRNYLGNLRNLVAKISLDSLDLSPYFPLYLPGFPRFPELGKRFIGLRNSLCLLGKKSRKSRENSWI